MGAMVSLANRYEIPSYEEEGRILRDAYALCQNWYDGADSAMHKLVEEKSVPVLKILKELGDIIASETDVAKPWHERALAFKAYCLRQIAADKCRKTLSTAVRQARAAGLNKYEFSQLMQQASIEFSEAQERA